MLDRLAQQPDVALKLLDAVVKLRPDYVEGWNRRATLSYLKNDYAHSLEDIEQAMIGMLGALSAEARVARFLVSLADRFAAMGYSSKLFNLRMTRHEIGSYLGLTLETVSRTLSAFNEIGLITVDQRTIGIKDAEALKTLRRLPPSRSRDRSLPLLRSPKPEEPNPLRQPRRRWPPARLRPWRPPRVKRRRRPPRHRAVRHRKSATPDSRGPSGATSA